MTGADSDQMLGGDITLSQLLPPSATLLGQPLAYFSAEHLRLRCVCALLRHIAFKKSASWLAARTLAAFLCTDFPLHHEDEERDLFPALRRRARPEDDLGPMLTRLVREHRQSEALASSIAKELRAADAGGEIELPHRLCDAVEKLAADEHAHLAMENAIILALARRRLTPSDLHTLTIAMRSRRGISTDVENP